MLRESTKSSLQNYTSGPFSAFVLLLHMGATHQQVIYGPNVIGVLVTAGQFVQHITLARQQVFAGIAPGTSYRRRVLRLHSLLLDL